MKKILKALAAAAGAATAVYAGYAAYAFRRYGKPDISGAPDPVFDQFMPTYEVRDHHSIRIQAPAPLVMTLARRLPLDAGRLSRLLFAMRGLPARLQGHTAPLPSQGLEADAVAIGWGVLADIPERHLVMGSVTRPWQANVVFERVAPEEFAAFAMPDYARIGWAIRVEADGPDACHLTIETRVATTDAGARRKFRRYWALLSPGIKAIRFEMLSMVKRAAESRVRGVAA